MCINVLRIKLAVNVFHARVAVQGRVRSATQVAHQQGTPLATVVVVRFDFAPLGLARGFVDPLRGPVPSVFRFRLGRGLGSVL